jgi:hypothetical protein
MRVYYAHGPRKTTEVITLIIHIRYVPGLNLFSFYLAPVEALIL